MLRKLLILGLLPAVLLLGAACGGDDDGDGDGGGDDPTATAAATEAPDEATTAPTEEPTEAPTEEPMDDEPTFLAAASGLTCTGDWTNLTFGSTGSFEAAFDINEAGDAGTVTVTLGGFVFGVGGGTVELPVTVDGDNVVVDTAADFLGNAKLTFDSSGAATDAVFEAPPAFNNAASKATLEDFAFDGSSLSTTIQIDFGDGNTATSEINSTCA
jgi:hypothetical protein